MNTPKLAAAIGRIDSDLVADAIDYKPQKKRITSLCKGIIAAAACLVLVLGITVIHAELKQYTVQNNIQVGLIASGAAADFSTATEHKGDKLWQANYIHNLLANEGVPFYGCCFYDSDSDKIMLGITENSEANRARIAALIGDRDITFFECGYSFQYLEELYDRLNDSRFALKLLGVDGFCVSEESNRLTVTLAGENCYAAIYAVNELYDCRGAAEFVTAVQDWR